MFSNQKFNLANHSKQQAYRALVLSDSPTAYWRLGESSGTTTSDETGSYDGTYVGSPTLGATGIFNGNNAVDLSGTEYSTIPDNDAFSLSDFTVEFWIKPSSLPPASSGNRMFIFTKGDVSNYEYEVSINSFNDYFGKLYFTRYQSLSGTLSRRRASSSTIIVNTWTHCVITVSGISTTPDIYINGSLDNGDELVVGLGSLTNGNSALNLGRRGDNAENNFSGSIDEVAIYPTALSATQIKRHYDIATR